MKRTHDQFPRLTFVKQTIIQQEIHPDDFAGSVYDDLFPGLYRKSDLIDIKYSQILGRKVDTWSARNFPVLSDFQLFQKLGPNKKQDLIARGISSRELKIPVEEEVFETLDRMSLTPEAVAGDPRESSTDPVQMDVTDIPDRTILSETVIIESPGPSGSTKEDTLPPLRTKRVRTTTNVEMQGVVERQESLSFPRLTFTTDPQVPGAHQPPSHDTSAPQTTVLEENLKDLGAKITSLAHLVAAQSQVTSTVQTLNEEVKTLVAEFITMRAELQQNNNMLQILIKKLSTTPISYTESHKAPQSSTPEFTDLDDDLTHRDTYANYYDQYIAKYNWVGLTREIFVMFGIAKDAYTKAKKLYPGMLIGRDIFECFRTGEFNPTVLSTLNRELIRLASSLHRESYLPSGGIGVPYKPTLIQKKTPAQYEPALPPSEDPAGDGEANIWEFAQRP